MRRESSIDETEHRSWETSSFWKPTIVTLLAVILLVAGLNFIVDPFGLYGTRLFPQITFNRYSNLRGLYTDFNPKPEALIIGSSRVGCIDPDIVTDLTGYDCFNWGVPAAEAEILLTILKIAIDDFDTPLKMVIVGVEPEIFHPTKRVHPQAMVLRDYTKHFIDDSGLQAFMESSRRLITFEQLWMSAVVIKRKITNSDTGDWMIWRKDGFPIGIIEERLPARYVIDPEKHIDHQVEIFPETFFRLSEFDSLGNERQGYWEEFLAICDENSIEVYAFMPPPHPRILERLHDLGAGPIFDETEKYLRGTVNEVDGTFMNFTSVDSFNGDPEGFVDQVHIKPENGELMIRKLLENFESPE